MVTVTLTQTELALVISALDNALIDATDAQFTKDEALLSDILAQLDDAYPDELAGSGDGRDLFVATKALAQSLAEKFKEAA